MKKRNQAQLRKRSEQKKHITRIETRGLLVLGTTNQASWVSEQEEIKTLEEKVSETATIRTNLEKTSLHVQKTAKLHSPLLMLRRVRVMPQRDGTIQRDNEASPDWEDEPEDGSYKRGVRAKKGNHVRVTFRV